MCDGSRKDFALASAMCAFPMHADAAGRDVRCAGIGASEFDARRRVVYDKVKRTHSLSIRLQGCPHAQLLFHARSRPSHQVPKVRPSRADRDGVGEHVVPGSRMGRSEVAERIESKTPRLSGERSASGKWAGTMAGLRYVTGARTQSKP